jgi:hypothetical protein
MSFSPKRPLEGLGFELQHQAYDLGKPFLIQKAVLSDSFLQYPLQAANLTEHWVDLLDLA